MANTGILGAFKTEAKAKKFILRNWPNAYLSGGGDYGIVYAVDAKDPDDWDVLYNIVKKELA